MGGVGCPTIPSMFKPNKVPARSGVRKSSPDTHTTGPNGVLVQLPLARPAKSRPGSVANSVGVVLRAPR